MNLKEVRKVRHAGREGTIGGEAGRDFVPMKRSRQAGIANEANKHTPISESSDDDSLCPNPEKAIAGKSAIDDTILSPSEFTEGSNRGVICMMGLPLPIMQLRKVFLH